MITSTRSPDPDDAGGTEHLDRALSEFATLYAELSARCERVSAEKEELEREANRRSHRLVSGLMRWIGR